MLTGLPSVELSPHTAKWRRNTHNTHAHTHAHGSDWSSASVESALGMAPEAPALSAVAAEFNFKFSKHLKSDVPRKCHKRHVQI